MTLTTERQQFEAWFTNKYPRSYWGVEKTASGEYQGGLAAPLWEAWQESRRGLTNREAQPAEIGRRSVFTCSSCGAQGLDEPLESRCHCMGDGAHWVESALYTAPPAPAVPDGRKLVPVEPTEEMLRAAYRESGVYSAKAYRAMLAAAPEGGNDHDTRR